MITIDEAIRKMRSDPHYDSLVHDAYFDADTRMSSERFLNSEEFQAVLELLGERVQGAVVADIGAGTGIASYAFAKSGASHVYAVEPDPSDEVGRGAIERIRNNLPITIIDAIGESLPIPANSVDIVYARQVLHHIQDLPTALTEFARLLKPNGIFIACREHVVDDSAQLAEFLRNHPMHQLAGGENAYSLPVYLAAIEQSGLSLVQCIEPWDSIINAFPSVRTSDELAHYAAARLQGKFGALGIAAAKIPIVEHLTWQWIKRPIAGRMYTFVATKSRS